MESHLVQALVTLVQALVTRLDGFLADGRLDSQILRVRAHSCESGRFRIVDVLLGLFLRLLGFRL
jgi:hypothetical protein